MTNERAPHESAALTAEIKSQIEEIIAPVVATFPNTEWLLGNSKTRVGTALLGFLVESISNHNNTVEKAIIAAHDAVTHEDITSGHALSGIAHMYTKHGDPSLSKYAGFMHANSQLAAHPIMASYSAMLLRDGKVCGYPVAMFQPHAAWISAPRNPGDKGLAGKMSHISWEEDLFYMENGAELSDARRDAVFSLFRNALRTSIPAITQDDLRLEEHNEHYLAIFYTGYEQDLRLAECSRLLCKAEHGHANLDDIKDQIERVAQEQSKRHAMAKKAAAIIKPLSEGIIDVLNVKAADIHLALESITPKDAHSDGLHFIIEFEGTKFDFSHGKVVSKMKTTVEIYLKTVLPQFIAAQRRLQSRIDQADPQNAIIEGPVARQLENLYGNSWVNLIPDILKRPKGVKKDGWSASLNNGIIRGQFNLNDNVRWERGTIVVEETSFPEMVIASMVGKNLKEVVEHHTLGDHVITKAVNHKRFCGIIDVRLRCDIPDLRVGDFVERLAA